MTIRASHYALVDLSSEYLKRNRYAGKGGHIGAFVSQVVEIEKVDIGFAAINARMIPEVLAQPGPQLQCVPVSPDPSVPDLLLRFRLYQSFVYALWHDRQIH